MSISKSCGTGKLSISNHDPSRRARTIASTTAIKTQIPNHSLEDVHEHPKGSNINPGIE